MFPLHLLLSPNATWPETPVLSAKLSPQPAMTRIPASMPEPSGARTGRRAAWALTWLGPETHIVPLVGMNVPEMGR